MFIKEVHARIIEDSRHENTIEISVNACVSSAPSGKSKGKHEKKPYKKNLETDVKFINNLDLKKFPPIYYLWDLEKIEKKLRNKIGANTLFALEASILKALAVDKKKQLWQILNPKLEYEKNPHFPRILSNTIGGGAHSSNKVKPDFQEFLITCNKNPGFSREVNKKAYFSAKRILDNLRLNNLGINDENALNSDLENEQNLEVLKEVQENIHEEAITHLDLGIDVAASQFFNKKKYEYKNKNFVRTSEEQMIYMAQLAEKYNLFYLEDPLEEEDFKGFAELCKRVNCFIVGDDLTVTNLKRVEKAIKMKAITGVIIKPNQTGSILEVKKIFDLCNKECIKTIVSHRSGETLDSSIADIAFAFQADFIKTPVFGKEREAKVLRLIEIENHFKR